MADLSREVQGLEPKHLKRGVCKRQGQPLDFFERSHLPAPAEFSHLLLSAWERNQNPGTALSVHNEAKCKQSNLRSNTWNKKRTP